MRKFTPFLLTVAVVTALLIPALAQPPAGKDAKAQDKQPTKDYSESSIVTKMMAFNKKKDGKLTREEITDTRVLRLFDLADANKDGVVTREELMALAAKLDADWGAGGGFGKGGKGGEGFGKGGKGGDGFGKGGKGGDGKDGKGGKGGDGFGKGGKAGDGFGKGPGAAPLAGPILPPGILEELNLAPEQRKLVGELQKEVDALLSKILTEDQKKQLKEIRDRNFGGKGEPGGKGGDGFGKGGKGGDGFGKGGKGGDGFGKGGKGGDGFGKGGDGKDGKGPGGKGPGGDLQSWNRNATGADYVCVVEMRELRLQAC